MFYRPLAFYPHGRNKLIGITFTLLLIVSVSIDPCSVAYFATVQLRVAGAKADTFGRRGASRGGLGYGIFDPPTGETIACLSVRIRLPANGHAAYLTIGLLSLLPEEPASVYKLQTSMCQP